MCRFPDAPHFNFKQKKNVSCNAVQIITLWTELKTYCSTFHLFSTCALIKKISVKDKGCGRNPNLSAFINSREQCLFPLQSYRKWHKIKTTATDHWRWWPEHCDWWCMLDVRVQTITGSQEVNRMCANRNKRWVFLHFLVSHTEVGIVFVSLYRIDNPVFNHDILLFA